VYSVHQTQVVKELILVESKYLKLWKPRSPPPYPPPYPPHIWIFLVRVCDLTWESSRVQSSSLESLKSHCSEPSPSRLSLSGCLCMSL